MRRRPIGQILIDKGEISEVDLEAALAEQERSGRRLGEILIESGRTSWLALARAIAEQVLDIQDVQPKPEPEPEPEPAARLVPPSPFQDPELKLHSVEAMLRERQRAFIELVTTTETLRMKIARLEEILEERDRELTRLRVLRAS
jgi:hypothetical protein